MDDPGWTVQTFRGYDSQDLVEKGSRGRGIFKLMPWLLVEFLDGYNVNN